LNAADFRIDCTQDDSTQHPHFLVSLVGSITISPYWYIKGVPRQDKLGKGGSDVGSITETFRWNPVGNQSHPEELGQQPEASLAWTGSDPGCEA
jgi:hypothetical protein